MMPELVRIHVPERPAPRAHGFVGQRDAPVAEAEAAMQPDAVAHNLGREPMTLRGVDGR